MGSKDDETKNVLEKNYVDFQLIDDVSERGYSTLTSKIDVVISKSTPKDLRSVGYFCGKMAAISLFTMMLVIR